MRRRRRRLLLRLLRPLRLRPLRLLWLLLGSWRGLHGPLPLAATERRRTRGASAASLGRLRVLPVLSGQLVEAPRLGLRLQLRLQRHLLPRLCLQLLLEPLVLLEQLEHLRARHAGAARVHAAAALGRRRGGAARVEAERLAHLRGLDALPLHLRLQLGRAAQQLGALALQRADPGGRHALAGARVVPRARRNHRHALAALGRRLGELGAAGRGIDRPRAGPSGERGVRTRRALGAERRARPRGAPHSLLLRGHGGGAHLLWARLAPRGANRRLRLGRRRLQGSRRGLDAAAGIVPHERRTLTRRGTLARPRRGTAGGRRPRRGRAAVASHHRRAVAGHHRSLNAYVVGSVLSAWPNRGGSRVEPPTASERPRQHLGA